MTSRGYALNGISSGGATFTTQGGTYYNLDGTHNTMGSLHDNEIGHSLPTGTTPLGAGTNITSISNGTFRMGYSTPRVGSHWDGTTLHTSTDRIIDSYYVSDYAYGNYNGLNWADNEASYNNVIMNGYQYRYKLMIIMIME